MEIETEDSKILKAKIITPKDQKPWLYLLVEPACDQFGLPKEELETALEAMGVPKISDIVADIAACFKDVDWETQGFKMEEEFVKHKDGDICFYPAGKINIAMVKLNGVLAELHASYAGVVDLPLSETVAAANAAAAALVEETPEESAGD